MYGDGMPDVGVLALYVRLGRQKEEGGGKRRAAAKGRRD
jgi:hypothetical protein